MDWYKNFSKNKLLRKVGNLSQVFGIRRVEYRDGDANLTKAFLVNNGSGMEFTVNENKCLDIFEMKYKGINLGFHSKCGLHSPYLADNRDGFYTYSQGCGMLYTAGLANVGTGAGLDNDLQYYHGIIKNKGAENVTAQGNWIDDSYELTISGEVREAAFYGRNLLLNREIKTKVGKNAIRIKDRIENQDFKPDNIMLLYHLNLGFPLLDEGSEFITPAAHIEPLGDYAREKLADYAKVTAPINDENECVYAITAKADEQGNTVSMLRNPSLGWAVYVKYNVKELPYMIEWKSMKAGDYAFGMLPATCRPVGRKKAMEQGDVKTLQPFESWEINLEIGVLDSLEEIEALHKHIEML